MVESDQMAWINKVPNAQPCRVHTIKKSAKGLILITNDYDVFLYADSQQAKHILEALEYWCNGDGYGYSFEVIPDENTKLGFRIELGNEHFIFHQDNCWSLDESIIQSENPYITKTVKASNKATPNPLLKAQAKQSAKKLHKELQDRIATGDLPDAPEAS